MLLSKFPGFILDLFILLSVYEWLDRDATFSSGVGAEQAAGKWAENKKALVCEVKSSRNGFMGGVFIVKVWRPEFGSPESDIHESQALQYVPKIPMIGGYVQRGKDRKILRLVIQWVSLK